MNRQPIQAYVIYTTPKKISVIMGNPGRSGQIRSKTQQFHSKGTGGGGVLASFGGILVSIPLRFKNAAKGTYCIHCKKVLDYGCMGT